MLKTDLNDTETALILLFRRLNTFEQNIILKLAKRYIANSLSIPVQNISVIGDMLKIKL